VGFKLPHRLQEPPDLIAILTFTIQCDVSSMAGVFTHVVEAGERKAAVVSFVT